MLEKILKLEHVGLFESGVSKAHALKKITLIYSDNARGKSTLSQMLRSCATGDPTPIVTRVTIGATAPPKVELRFSLAGSGAQVSFESGKWSQTVPQVKVFDQTFVDTHIYAGSEVHPSHHEALLEFALGDAAISKKQEIDTHSEARRSAATARTELEERLRPSCGSLSLEAFVGLPKEDGIDDQIKAIERRLVDCAERANILARREVKTLDLPQVDLGVFVATLEQSFEQLHKDAADCVRTHLARHGGHGREQWLREGQRLHLNDECPFCGQSTLGLDLVAAYQTFFNAAYIAHMKRVAALTTLAETVVPDTTIQSWERECHANDDRARAWNGQVAFDLPQMDFARLRSLTQTARVGLRDMAERKSRAPLDALDAKGLEETSACLKEIWQCVTRYNEVIARSNGALNDFKNALAQDDESALGLQLKDLRLRYVRFTPQVEAAIAEHGKWDAEHAHREDLIEKARKQLTDLMTDLLSRYEGDINQWLVHFGAAFKVGRLSATHIGGARTKYGIVLRSKHIVAGRATADAPSFLTALSDGDKRTLALAFFLAKAAEPSTCVQQILVLDDVFVSLDHHRRSQTIAALADLASKCAQIVVMGHDAYFLRDLNRALIKKKMDPVVLQICRVGDFSQIEPCDINSRCASLFRQRHRAIAEYDRNGTNDDLLKIAQMLRPFAEAVLHRRFPGHFKPDTTFGDSLKLIKDCDAADPLAVLKPLLPKLWAFNDFAKAFHHDGEDSSGRMEITDAELRPFSRQALDLLYKGVM